MDKRAELGAFINGVDRKLGAKIFGRKPQILLTGNGQRGIINLQYFQRSLRYLDVKPRNLGVMKFDLTTTLPIESRLTKIQLGMEQFCEDAHFYAFTPDLGVHFFAEGEYETVARTTQSLKELKAAFPNIPHLVVSLPPFTTNTAQIDRQNWSPEDLIEDLDMMYLPLIPSLPRLPNGSYDNSTFPAVLQVEQRFLSALALLFTAKSLTAEGTTYDPKSVLEEIKGQSRYVGVGMSHQQFSWRSRGHQDSEALDYYTSQVLAKTLSADSEVVRSPKMEQPNGAFENT